MATILYTSLAEIKSFNPCANGWKNILIGQGKKEVDNVLFPLIDCLNSNSINDVCWLLGKRKTEIDICVQFAKKCTDSVSHVNSKYAATADASAADAAAYAAYATADATATAADAAAATAATAAAYAAAYAAYATATAAYAQQKQIELNKQFLIECIKAWEKSH